MGRLVGADRGSPHTIASSVFPSSPFSGNRGPSATTYATTAYCPNPVHSLVSPTYGVQNGSKSRGEQGQMASGLRSYMPNTSVKQQCFSTTSYLPSSPKIAPSPTNTNNAYVSGQLGYQQTQNSYRENGENQSDWAENGQASPYSTGGVSPFTIVGQGRGAHTSQVQRVDPHGSNMPQNYGGGGYAIGSSIGNSNENSLFQNFGENNTMYRSIQNSNEAMLNAHMELMKNGNVQV